MTTSDKLREFCENWRSDLIKHGGIPEIPSDLTALISEDYVERAKYDEAVRHRDELREKYSKLLEATSELLKSVKTDNTELKKSIAEMRINMAAEIAAIKKTETK